MRPEPYLRRYTEPLQALDRPEPVDWRTLLLESDHHYPPSIELGARLEGMKRSELLAFLRQVLEIEFPQQRFTRRTIRIALETLHKAKDEREWKQAELERLTAALAQSQSDNEWMTAELNQHRAELQRLSVELERAQSQLAVTGSEAETLRANLAEVYGSSSWKATKPLRWLGRLGRAARAPDGL